MNNITVIREQEVLGKQFRVYGTNQEPLFLAKDVANWIENSNVTMMLKNIDEDEQIKISPKQSLGLLTSNNQYNFLTEDGLYEVLMQSRKPIAKQFKKEVKQILKTIRKTGGFVSNDDMFINQYLPFADETTRALFKSTLQTVRQQNELITHQKQTIVEKENIIDSVIDDDQLFAIGTVGKVLKSYCDNMGAIKIFEYMRGEKILINCERTQKHNTPYDQYNEYFEMKYVDSAFGTHVKPYFNGKGLKWFLNRLAKQGKITASQRQQLNDKF